jgi:hypothetical protein
MIKSSILSNDKLNGTNWLVVFAAVSGSVFLQSIILNKTYSAPLEIIIWYPLIAICSFLSVEFIVNIFFADWLVLNRSKYYLSIFYAIFIGFVISFLPFWGQIAAGMPLTLAQIGSYLLTLGIYPLAAGPDGFLRGLAWGLALAVSLAMFKSTKDIIKAVLLGLMIWLGMTIVILLPSLVLMTTFAFKSLPMAWSNTDLVAEFTRINLFSYWADGQILRWFTGFGSQAANSMLLYTGSVVYVVGSVFWMIINFQWIKKLLLSARLTDLLPLVPIVLFGYQAGFSRQGWIAIDWAAWSVLVFLFMFCWLRILAFVKDINIYDQSLFVMGLLGSLLLGWPVLLVYLLIISLVYFLSELKINNANQYILDLCQALFWPISALLIALFMQRGLALTNGSLKTLAVLAIFAITITLLTKIKNTEKAKIKALFIWSACSIALWIVSGIFAPVAIMLLAGVFLWIFWQKTIVKDWFVPVFVWSVALLMLFVVIWLPGLAKI